MTRLVPRPDWTPVEFVLAVRAAVWEQGVTPETAANRPTVLALFRPAEEPGIITATADHARPLEPIPWDDDYPRETPAPVAPPPAGEPAWMTSELRKNLDCMVFVDAQVFSQARASMVAAIDHAVLSALAALRAENERLRQQQFDPTSVATDITALEPFVQQRIADATQRMRNDAPAPAAPPPAGEPEENDPAIASALMSMDDFVLVKRDALARVSRAARTLRAENERLTGAIRDAGWAITGDERHVCPQCKPGLVQDAARPPEGGTER